MSVSLNSSINPAIHARQTALLYRNAGLGHLFTVLAAAPTAYLGYISRPGPVILVWLLCMVLAALFRYRLARRYRAARPPEIEAASWSARYIRLIAVQAVLWLIGCGAIVWGNTDSYRFLVVLVMVGMVAGAVPVLATLKNAFRVFSLPMIIGASIITFADATAPVHYVLGVVLLIFLAGVTRSADYFNEVLLESITVELEKSHLVRKAEAAVRAKGDFLANISHEIRTPMNTILGMAQLAFKAEHNPRQRDYLKKIQSSGEHLLGIIDDILDISRIDAGKLAIKVADFELAKVIDNLTNLVAKRAEEKNLRLSFDIDPSIPPWLRGDPLRLCQVLTNLANNAIKFTEKGEVVVRIKRVEDRTHALVRFEVQDTGIGMSRDETAVLFQSFQQTDSSTTRKYGGTGLGLVISKQLVEMMDGGKIGVESFPGKGSTFWFTVRLAEGVAPAESQSQESTKNESGVLRKIHGARILLVDDNVFNLEVAADFLLSAGADVRTAGNGKEAIDLLHRQRFDCVLMDVQMPVMDGIEAVRQIRRDPAIDDVRVIAMTANASREDRARYLGAGMDDVIVKPFKYQTLFTTLAKWLPRKKPGGEGRVRETDVEVRPSRNEGSDETKLELTGHPDIIDLAVLAEMIGNDRRKLGETAGKFVASLRKDMQDIEAALEREDLPALGALGHHSKTPARMVGAIGFADLCQALEDNARGGNMDRARDIVGQLRLLPVQIEQQIARVLP
jgi:signal transduction histidine kinase/HPt (histidine-containing phosphotransfer) domain-containing protein/ActR/RegA family two-component response regulator